MDKKEKLKIKKISIDANPKTWIGIILMFLFVLIFPIYLGEYLDNPSILGINTDNTGRYINIPIVNIPFDRQLKDTNTISLIFISILIILLTVFIFISFNDFKKRITKYKIRVN